MRGKFNFNSVDFPIDVTRCKFFFGKQCIRLFLWRTQKINFGYNFRSSFEIELSESICKPKHLWKVLKSLGLLSKTSSFEGSTFKVKNKFCMMLTEF